MLSFVTRVLRYFFTCSGLCCPWVLPVCADMVGHGGIVRDIDVSPDGRLAVTGSFDYSVRLWAFAEQREQQVLQAHEGPVNRVRFVAGGRLAVSGGSDGRLALWSVGQSRPVRVLHAYQSRLAGLATANDGSFFVTASWDGEITLWSVPDGRRLDDLRAGVELVAVGMGRADQLILAGARDGTIRVFRKRDHVQVAAVRAHDVGLTQLQVSPDGQRIMTVGHDAKVRFWDSHDLSVISEHALDPHSMPVSAAISRDGSFGLVGFFDGKARQISAATGDLVRTISAEAGPVWAVALSPDGRFALTAGKTERVRVWHLDSGDRIDAGSDGAVGRPTPWLSDSHPGARLFRKCAACHALTSGERQRAGPHFAGLYGRRAGAVKNYRYSKALAGSSVVWNHATVADLFRQGPDRYLPGTKMPVQRIGSETQLRDLVDYLGQLLERPVLR